MKDVLNRLVDQYNDTRYLSSDPLELVHRQCMLTINMTMAYHVGFHAWNSFLSGA